MLKAETVIKVEERLDYKIKTDQVKGTKERIWQLEKEFGQTPKNAIIKEEMKELKNDLEELNNSLKVLEKK